MGNAFFLLLLAGITTEETCPDPVLTPTLTLSLVPIHAKPQYYRDYSGWFKPNSFWLLHE